MEIENYERFKTVAKELGKIFPNNSHSSVFKITLPKDLMRTYMEKLKFESDIKIKVDESDPTYGKPYLKIHGVEYVGE